MREKEASRITLRVLAYVSGLETTENIHSIFIEYVRAWGRDTNGEFSGRQKTGHEEI